MRGWFQIGRRLTSNESASGAAGRPAPRFGPLRLFVAVLCLAAIALSIWRIESAAFGLDIDHIAVDGTPVSIYRPATDSDTAHGQTAPDAGAPVVVIAHGFAGSRRLMDPFAVTLARNGYIAVSFDFRGHGRNPAPLTGSILDEDGATRALMEQTARIVEVARTLDGGDGRVALLGHSMASDIIVRQAQADPAIAAVVAVSMFSPVVTADTPENLLVIVGGWEAGLIDEALRAVGLATAPEAAEPGITYGAIADGSARRVAIAPSVEHVGVLYARTSMAEALAWIDAVFGRTPAPDPFLDARGGWIALLLAAIIVLAWPLAALLPTAAAQPLGAGLGWRRLWPVLVVPALATPLILRVVPIGFLPVLVADYLAVHFALYGALTFAGILWLARQGPDSRSWVGETRWRALWIAAIAIAAYSLFALGGALDRYVTSFMPIPARLPIIAALMIGTALYFLATEWLARGMGAARGGYLAAKTAFLVSLAIAVALDLERLFFLLIIVPVIVIFFIVYGLFSQWAYARTRHPVATGIAHAVAFAWALGVTFPLLGS